MQEETFLRPQSTPADYRSTPKPFYKKLTHPFVSFFHRSKRILRAVGPVLIVVIIAIAAYSTYQLHEMKQPNYQQKLLQKQTTDIVRAVGKIFQLPEGTPQIATISDVDSLRKNQPFFNLAKNGDIVLVYSNEIILYRGNPSKVINVAPVSTVAPPEVSGDTPKDVETPTKKPASD
jgi:hypothetical protein